MKLLSLKTFFRLKGLSALGILAFAVVGMAATPGPYAIPLNSLILSGNAQLSTSGISLTTTFYQDSSAFIPQPFALGSNDDFSAYITYTAQNVAGGGIPADGIAFVVQNIGAPGYLGLSGSGLGFFTLSSYPAVGITFDYYANGITGSPAGTASIAMPTGAVLVQTVPNLSVFPGLNGQRSVWIYYSHATKELDVYFSNAQTKPATPLLSTVLSTDLSTLLNGQAYFGVTAADGQFESVQNLTYFALSVHETQQN